MRITHLQTVRASEATTRCHKFEQVSSDDHQMSLAGGLMSGGGSVGGEGPVQ